jgi:hypothetical protein
MTDVITPTSHRLLSLLPLHTVKDQGHRAPSPTANSYFSRSSPPRALAAQAPLSRSTRTLLRSVRSVVEVNGIEPSTSCLQSRRSPN